MARRIEAPAASHERRASAGAAAALADSGAFSPRAALGRAGELAAALRRQGCEAAISINVSAADMADPALPAAVAQVFAAHALSPGAIKLELLETHALADPAGMAAAFERLKAAGARMALDDFGAGHSALAWLWALPADEVKLDLAFARALSLSPARARVIAGAIIGLAHALDMQVTAEGIETEPEMRVFRELGCDLGQGYFLARPMSGAALLGYARAKSAGGFHKISAEDGPDGWTGSRS